MGKKFNQLPPTGRSEGSKLSTERDFLDVLNEESSLAAMPIATSPVLPSTSQDAETPGTIGNTGTTGNAGTTDNTNTSGNVGATDNADTTSNTSTTGNTDTPRNSPRKRKSGTASNNRNPGNTLPNPVVNPGSKPDNNGNPGNTTALPLGHLEQAVGQERSVRQTIVIGSAHLERLRDLVHARRAQGDYNYSQKEAIETALDLLFALYPPVAGRPEQVRQREQQRAERIRHGRRTTDENTNPNSSAS